MNERKVIDIRPQCETRYTAGYRAHESQIRENTRKRVKRKEEALERVKTAFLRLGLGLSCFAFGLASIWATDGDATFAVFAVLVGVFIIFGKEVFER